MVIVREYQESDFNEVVDMYYDMCHQVYPHREFKSKQFFYKQVLDWIDYNYDIIITEDEGIVTGFSMCYVDSMGGITEDYYQGECVYVKKKYRKGRSAYLMYHTNMNYANKMGYLLSTNASDVTESSHISAKLGTKIFSKFEKQPQGE